MVHIVALDGSSLEIKRVSTSEEYQSFLSLTVGADIPPAVSGGEKVLISRGDNKLVGFVRAGLDKDGIVHIYPYILPEYRLNGYGRAAVIALCEALKERGAWAIQLEPVDVGGCAFCQTFDCKPPYKINIKELLQ